MSEQKPQYTGFVAYLDLLGFSEDSFSEEISKQFDTYYGTLEKKIVSPLEFIIASDSIIIYSIKDELDDFTKLVKCCSEIYTEFIRKKYPFRGSITHGNFKLKQKKGTTILIGKPLVEAYNLERIQDWIGIILSPGVNKIFNDKRWDREVVDWWNLLILSTVPSNQNELTFEAIAIIPNKLSTFKKMIQNQLRVLMIQAPINSQHKYRVTLDWIDNLEKEQKYMEQIYRAVRK